MIRRGLQKGKATRSLIIPANVPLNAKARKSISPRKFPYKKATNVKSKSGKKAKSFAPIWKETESVASDEPTASGQAGPQPTLLLKQKRSRRDSTVLTEREIFRHLTNDNEPEDGNETDASATTFVSEKQNESPLPDTTIKDKSKKRKYSTNLTPFFNERPNQSLCPSILKDCNLTTFECTAGSSTTKSRSIGLRNKPLSRDLSIHAESLHKLSRATKLSGTINKGKKTIDRQKEIKLKNVTFRRKYPLRNVESSNKTILSKNDELEKPYSPAKLQRKPVVPKKIPDFSAIHQQNFGKMESIVDHLERKAHRALLLSTSTVKKGEKVKPAVKKENASKESIVQHLKCRAQRTLVLTPPTVKKVAVDVKKVSNSNMVSKRSLIIRQRVNLKSDENSKPVQLASVLKLDTKFDKLQSNKVAKKIARIEADVSKAKVDDVNNRLMENRGMYKGNTEVGGKNRQKKNVEILRGVRSNRRFELQMKYRDSRNLVLPPATLN